MLRLNSPAELTDLSAQLGNDEWLVLGGGSNVVLPEYYAGTVVMPQFLGIEQLACEHGLRIKAFAGENWHGFVAQCVARGWWGLENLALIPGTVGAAPIQNIGAYGLEVAQRIESVTVWDCQAQAVRELPAAECGFGYRDSVFKRGSLGKIIVVAVTFLLPSAQNWQPIAGYADVARALNGANAPTAQAIFDAVIAIRQAKLPDPAVIGNAGSFFKNPVVTAAQAALLLALHPKLPHYPQANGEFKLAAAWLIDQCGFKGRGADLGNGKIGVHPQQALVLVNLAGQGNAVAEDLRAVADEIQAVVNERFGVLLEVEPIFVS
jgi:UDP-N-acetylmuramate dehydrogenase